MSHVDREDAIQGKIVHEYDGIEEADNDLPKWWLYIFYTSIVFAGCYWYVYHELGAQPLPNQAYTEAVMARAGTEVTEELLVAMAADSSAVAMGADIFAANCVVCHNARGEGNIGPNLTDDHWFHGGSPLNIHGTIANGVLDTNSPGGGGMPQWDGILGGQGTMRVTAYVLSIQNTFVEGKAAQGEVWPPPGGEGEEGSEEEGEAEAGSVEAGTVDTGAAEEAGAQHDPNAEDEAEDEGAAATEDGAEDSVEGPSAALEGEAPSDANPSDPTGETGAPSEGARPVIVRADETPE